MRKTVFLAMVLLGVVLFAGCPTTDDNGDDCRFEGASWIIQDFMQAGGISVIFLPRGEATIRVNILPQPADPPFAVMHPGTYRYNGHTLRVYPPATFNGGNVMVFTPADEDRLVMTVGGNRYYLVFFQVLPN